MIVCCLLVGGCVSEKVTLGPDGGAQHRYLDRAALAHVVQSLPGLQYPLTRAETLAALDLTDRNLPSLRSTEPLQKESALLTNDQESINLTDPEKPGRRYRLLLWYDPVARELGGESFIKARIINYAELLLEEDGTAGEPKGTYLLQAPRFPYVRLEYPRQLKAKAPAKN
jgi:hypothetical protein